MYFYFSFAAQQTEYRYHLIIQNLSQPILPQAVKLNSLAPMPMNRLKQKETAEYLILGRLQSFIEFKK